MLKARIHSTPMTFGRPCPVSDLFGVAGRNMLAALDVPDPWRGTVDASLLLIDDFERQIALINAQLKATGPEHPYVPLLMSAVGIGWVLAFTIAAEIGESRTEQDARGSGQPSGRIDAGGDRRARVLAAKGLGCR